MYAVYDVVDKKNENIEISKSKRPPHYGVVCQ
jgi:hypothetical protein